MKKGDRHKTKIIVNLDKNTLSLQFSWHLHFSAVAVHVAGDVGAPGAAGVAGGGRALGPLKLHGCILGKLLSVSLSSSMNIGPEETEWLLLSLS